MRIQKRLIKLISLFSILLCPYSVYAAGNCAVPFISGDHKSCESIQLKFNLKNCNEAEKEGTPKITCNGDTATAVLKTAKNTHTARLKKVTTGFFAGSWEVDGAITTAENKVAPAPKKAKKRPVRKRRQAKRIPLPTPKKVIPPPKRLPSSETAKAWKIGGQARVRITGTNNKDFTTDSTDQLNYSSSRFRLNFGFNPNPNTSIFFQPQFTKKWGVKDGTDSTSGALKDTGLDVHQAYLKFGDGGIFAAQLGRQELIFGDHLVVGSVGYHDVARAFDMAKFIFTYKLGSTQLFSAKLTENNYSSGTNGGDKDFHGIYVNFKLDPWVKDLDLYSFNLVDLTGSTSSEVKANGIRLKSKFQYIDYRVEGTFESVNDESESQIDAELGVLLPKTRLAFEYFTASKGYNQLFPTAHKWLGFADFFKRQNINGFRFGVGNKWTDKFSTRLDFHSFSRTDTAVQAYNFGGGSYGTTGDSAAIGSEIDFTTKYKLNPNLVIKGGFSTVIPGQYLKDNGLEDNGSYYFIQAVSNF